MKKILVPVDGSEVTQRVIASACVLGKVFDSAMTFAHVLVLPETTKPGIPIELSPFEEIGKKILQSAKKTAEERGCRADAILDSGVGNAGHTLVRIARENNFDLIVIGARGKSRIVTLLVGSVCDTVTRNARCPVLVVR